MVTTEEQRQRWGLPDLSADGRAGVVNEARALDMLGDAAAWSAATVQPSADAEAAPRQPDDSGLAAVRALVPPGPRVDQTLGALECEGLPRGVREKLRHALLQSLEAGEDGEKALDRAAMAATLPWRTFAPVRFDPARLKQALDRTHGGLDHVKARLVELLAARPQACGALTVETPRRGGVAATETSALVVLPRTSHATAPIPCLSGARGTGKTSLAVAVAEALGRTHVRVTLDKHDTAEVIRGKEGDAPGRIIRGQHQAGVRNPVFILEMIDEVAPEVADALLDALDPAVCTAFRDQYLHVPFDLSAVVWIVTATDPGAIPEKVSKRLEVIAVPGYTEHEKLAIAEQHLLKRPFDVPAPAPAGCLAPAPAEPFPVVEPDVGPDGPAIVGEREVASLEELEALSARPPFPAAAAWAHGGVCGRRPLRVRGHPPADPRLHG